MGAMCPSFDAVPKMSLITHDSMVGGAVAGQQVTKDIAAPDKDNFPADTAAASALCRTNYPLWRVLRRPKLEYSL